MQVAQVSFRNNTVAQYNPQRVGLNQAATNFTATTQETKSDKNDKTLKYILIGAGALAAIVVAIKYKKIAELFKGKPEIKPKTEGVPQGIQKDASKNVGTVAPVEPTVADTLPEKSISERQLIFVENKDKACTSKANKLIRAARNGDAEALKNEIVKRRIAMSKQKDNKFDYWQNSQLYRFVGESEVNVLLKENKHVFGYKNSVTKVDTTLDSNYNFAHAEYRVSFKPKEKFDPAFNSEDGIPYTYLKNGKSGQCVTEGGYCLDDVEKIHTRDENGEWTKVLYSSKK